MYQKIDNRIFDEIKKIVGSKNIIIEKEKMEDYSHDEMPLVSIREYPEVVVKPETADQISRLMVLANDNKIPLVPRGGATGLCGGCIPIFRGIVLSLERMNKILEIDKENLMVTMEAGLTLRDFHDSMEKENLLFPPHPGEDSATVGGIIATNAGGARAVKYGTVRNFVREIEAVLADGTIVKLGGKVMKDSTGYNLLHLLIGSEGTLGIVTRAVLSVIPLPSITQTLIIPFTSISEALTSVPQILCNGIFPLSVEFITSELINITKDFLGKSWPVKDGKVYLLVILEGEFQDEIERVCEKLSKICFDNNCIDVFVAENRQKQKEILEIRSMVYEALKDKTIELLDITLPRNQIEPHLRKINEISEEENIWLPTYGHAADGNIHTHITRYDNSGRLLKNCEGKYKKVRNLLHSDAKDREGKVSGEHGIGLVKKEYMDLFLDKAVMGIMRKIKIAFDQNNILNPGKIFD